MKYTKKVRGYALQVIQAPKKFVDLLAMCKLFNDASDEKLEEALCASCHNNELQHPAAERFAYGQAEYICEVYKLGNIRTVLKGDDFSSASDIVKWGKLKVGYDGKKEGREEFYEQCAKGKMKGFWSQEQAQKFWDEEVKVYSGLGKVKATGMAKLNKVIWADRKNTVDGMVDAGLDGEGNLNIILDPHIKELLQDIKMIDVGEYPGSNDDDNAIDSSNLSALDSLRNIGDSIQKDEDEEKMREMIYYATIKGGSF